MEGIAPKASGGLSSLSLDQSRQYGKKPTLLQAGKAFEGLFMNTMMKSMRDAQIEGGLLDSEHEKPFRAMLDQAYSELAVKNMRLGLAENIERQFTPQIGKRNAEVPPMAKGKD
jgi:Rod binding domain-containing protein